MARESVIMSYSHLHTKKSKGSNQEHDGEYQLENGHTQWMKRRNNIKSEPFEKYTRTFIHSFIQVQAREKENSESD
jgi:hypothetical protein